MIESLELVNFRSHEQLRMDFNELRTLLVGPNGAGKSSVIDAISWALRGQCRGVNAKGEGQKDLIRVGANHAAVRVNMAGGWHVLRSVSHADGAKTSMKPDMVLGRLGTSDAMLAAVIYGRHFFDMHHADAKRMIMGLLDVRVKPDQLPDLKLSAPIDLDDLEALHDSAFEERKAKKQAIQQFYVPDNPAQDITLAGLDLKGLKADLKEKQKTVRDTAQTKGGADQAAGTLRREIATGEQAASGLAGLRGNLEAHDGMLIKHQEQLKEAQAHQEALDDQPAEPLKELRASVLETQTLIDKIGTHDPERGCVLDAAIPCLTKATKFSGQVTKLKKLVKGLEDRIGAGAEHERQLAAAAQRVADAQRHVDYHQEQINELTGKINAAMESEAKLDQLRADLAAAVVKQDETATAMAAADADAQAVQTKIDSLTKFEQQKANHAAATKALVVLQDELKVLEDRVTLLGPKGIRLTVLQATVGEFEATINAALAPFACRLEIQVDPWMVRVATPMTDDQTVPWVQLSGGQQVWTGLAFQLALAAVSGLDFCAADAADTVVGEARGALTQVVMAAPVRQIIVAMAKGEHDPLPVLDGLQVVPFGMAEAVPA